MCENCLTKDFCSCLQESFKQFKVARRDKAVKAVLAALKKKNVPYHSTRIENVVTITTDTCTVFLSLKSTRNDKGHTEYKFRLQGSQQWSSMLRNEFYTWICLLLGNIPKARKTQPVGEQFHSTSTLVMALSKKIITKWEFQFYSDLHEWIFPSEKQLAVKQRLDDKMNALS